VLCDTSARRFVQDEAFFERTEKYLVGKNAKGSKKSQTPCKAEESAALLKRHRMLAGMMVCMSATTPEILARARKIKLFLMDVDGTLTDGSVNLISLPADGSVAEMKGFNSQDGMGLKLAHTMGIRTGFITGRKSPAVSQRAHELKVEFVYLGQETKMAAFDECLQKAGVQEDEVAYMGDDLPDMPPAKRAGLAVAVANAAPELKAISHYVTNSPGGAGSAREVVELILKAQGRWEEAIPRALA
jgi:3-deoxy-D-manno-octulosonate 8-phosphate phosphatase (KDO 8-P phosphatase)